jgi:excinuclease ABC subunit A
MLQLDRLVEAGNTVIVIEHDMRVVAGSDWVLDIGPGAGEEGGRLVASGTPLQLSEAGPSLTAPYLARFLRDTPDGRLDLRGNKARVHTA